MAKSSKHIKSKQSKKHYNKSNNRIAFIVVLIFMLILFIYSKNKVTLEPYKNIQIILNNENITANMKDIVINENNQIYMSMDDIETFLDNTIYFEEESGYIITTSSKKLASFKVDDNNIIINGSTLKMDCPAIEKNEKKYIAISEMENVYDYEFEFIEKTNVATIDNLNKKQVKANLKKGTKLKESDGAFSKTIEKLSKNEEVIYIADIGNKTKIRTLNGNIGYVKSKLLINYEVVREDFIDKSSEKNNKDNFEYDLTNKDITTFEKRQNIINLILQQVIKNGKMYVKLAYEKDMTQEYERFIIEAKPILEECGITLL